MTSFAKTRSKLNSKIQSEVVNVLEANEALHASFFTYSSKDVQKNAELVIKAINKVSKSTISKKMTFAKTKLKEIKSKNMRKINNESYAIASAAFVHIVNTYDVGPKYNSYSCPMVNKKWVQNSKKKLRTHNPYAPEMPHCGQRDTDHK
jgi:hypothetical protein